MDASIMRETLVFISERCPSDIDLEVSVEIKNIFEKRRYMKRKRGSGFKDNSNLDKTFKTIKNMEKYDHMGATTKETTET